MSSASSLVMYFAFLMKSRSPLTVMRNFIFFVSASSVGDTGWAVARVVSHECEPLSADNALLACAIPPPSQHTHMSGVHTSDEEGEREGGSGTACVRDTRQRTAGGGVPTSSTYVHTPHPSPPPPHTRHRTPAPIATPPHTRHLPPSLPSHSRTHSSFHTRCVR